MSAKNFPKLSKTFAKHRKTGKTFTKTFQNFRTMDIFFHRAFFVSNFAIDKQNY